MIDWIHTLPASAKLALTLFSIVVFMRAKAPMGVAFLLGGCVLWLFFPMPWRGFALAVVKGLTDVETLFLAGIVVVLLVFSSSLKATGQIDRIIGAFRAIVGRSRSSLVAFPALIGLIPMPGGAIFSAPMVEAAVKDSRISAARSTAANYWFRHVWEFWFPLYPGVILFLTLTGTTAGQFALRQIPLTLFAFVVGFFFILRGVRLGDGRRERDYSAATVRAFARELVPIFLVVFSVVVVEFFVDKLASVFGIEIAILKKSFLSLGLVLGLAWLFVFRGLTWPVLGKLFIHKRILTMVFMVFGLMVFQSIVNRCGAVGLLQQEIYSRGVSTPVAISLLAFVAGVVMGIGFGFVGASFPFVIPLVAAMHLSRSLEVTHYALAFSWGFAGMMLSPVHICLLLTNEYFKSRMLRVYGYLAPLCAAMAVAASLLFLLYRAMSS